MEKFHAKLNIEATDIVYDSSRGVRVIFSDLHEPPGLIYDIEGPYTSRVRPYCCSRNNGNEGKKVFWVEKRNLIKLPYQLELFPL